MQLRYKTNGPSLARLYPVNQSLQDLFESLPEEETQEFEPYEPRKRSPYLIPWLIVAGIVIAAAVVAVVVVNSMGGEPDAQPAPTTSTPAVPTPADPAPTPTADPTPTPEPDDGVPDVDVGETFTMPIEAWGTQAEVSYKFGTVNYTIPDDNLILSSPLINSLPEECASMRNQWGVTRIDGGFEVLKPAERCEAAPEVYDELWGLTAAMVDSMQ